MEGGERADAAAVGNQGHAPLLPPSATKRALREGGTYNLRNCADHSHYESALATTHRSFVDRNELIRYRTGLAHVRSMFGTRC